MSYFNDVEENKCFRRVLEKSDYKFFCLGIESSEKAVHWTLKRSVTSI